MRTNSTERLGRALRDLRGEQTQRDAADKLGWDPSLLAKFERGMRLPSEEQLAAILDAYGEVRPEVRSETALLHAEEQLRKRLPVRSSMFDPDGESPVTREGRVYFESANDPGRQDMLRYRQEVEKEISDALLHAKYRLLTYQCLRFSTLAFTVAAPVFAALHWPAWVTALAAATALLTAGVVPFTRLNDRAVVDQRRASALHREVRMYRNGVGCYAADGRDSVLVERIEAIREQGDNDRIAVTQQGFDASMTPATTST